MPDKHSFHLRPSRLLLVGSIVAGLLVLAAVLLSSLTGLWLVLAMLVPLLMLSWLRDGWLPGNDRQLCTDGDRWWWSHRPDRAGRLRQSRVWPWWVYLEWRGAGGVDEASVLIDRLPADEFRRLRMLAAQTPMR